MFASKTILKRLMKKTFKNGGLKIASMADEDYDVWIYIGGSYWDFWCLENFLDKEIKATIVELTGQLPKTGEAYKATKGENQMVMLSTVPDFEVAAKTMVIPYLSTALYQTQGDTLLNFLQGPHGHVIAVNSVFTNLVFEGIGTEKREDGEIAASGPYAADDFESVLWKNNVGGLRAYAHYPNEKNEEDEFWRDLENIKIPTKLY